MNSCLSLDGYEIHNIANLNLIHERLEKRGEVSLPNTLWLQFDTMDTRFLIKLEKQEQLLLGPVLVHDNSTVIEHKAPGLLPYQGTRLLALQPATRSIPREQWETISSLAGKIEVDEKPLAAFMLQTDPAVRVMGGFEWQGRFLQLKDSDDPSIQSTPGGMVIMVEQEEEEKEEAGEAMANHRNTTAGLRLFEKPQQRKPRYRCGHDQLPFNTMPHHHATPALPARLQARGDAPGQCLASLQVLPVAVVADCSYLRKFDGNRARAQANIINDFNLVNGIYERTFNLKLGLISIDLYVDCAAPEQTDLAWNRACGATPAPLQSRLSQFSWWRGKKQTSSQAGLFVLVSGCQDDTEVVGIAWLNQVCRRDAMRAGGQWVSGAAVTVFLPNQFAVLAHEIGHTLGAVHDCDREACAVCSPEAKDESRCQCCSCGAECDCRGRYVMHPESGGLSMKAFSACSQGDICRKLPILAQPCLLPPGATRLITGPQCGNGIKEAGEECDCGNAEQCRKDACCLEGCKLRPGARCADVNDPCCRSCQLVSKSENAVCREAEGVCSPAARCDGQSPECPPVRPLADGAACEHADGACATGICTSRDRQCAAVGQRLGITRACPLDRHSCSIVCQAAMGHCVYMDASFIDGTACGRKGFCRSGKCSEPFMVGWIQDNAALFYGILGFMALALLLLIGKVVWRRCQRVEGEEDDLAACPPPPPTAMLERSARL